MKMLNNHPLSNDLKGGELFMAVSLDRFSVKGPYEYGEYHYKQHEDSEDREIMKCCGCGLEIDETEEYVESELYGEEYIHDLRECLEMYYKHEKDLNGEFKSFVKGNMA